MASSDNNEIHFDIKKITIEHGSSFTEKVKYETTSEVNANTYPTFIIFMYDDSYEKFAISLRYRSGDAMIFYNSDNHYKISTNEDQKATNSFTGLFTENMFAILDNLNKKIDIDSTTSEISKNSKIIESILYEDTENEDIIGTHYNLNESVISNFGNVLNDIKKLKNEINNINDFLLFDNKDQPLTLNEYIETEISNSIKNILNAYINHLHYNGGNSSSSKYIESTEINNKGELIIYYSDDTADNLGKIIGTDGTDGFSPTVNIKNIENGTELTIVDKNGNHTINIMNGDDASAVECEFDAGKTVHEETATIGGTTYTVGTNAETFNDYENNKAIGDYSHVEGQNNYTVGKNSHAEGYKTYTIGENSHAEGYSTQAVGDFSHTEGSQTVANEKGAHVEGLLCHTEAQFCHAEGYSCKIMNTAPYSHVEGRESQCVGTSSHAEGQSNYAIGENSHAEGQGNNSPGRNSHVGGNTCVSVGENTFAHGEYLVTTNLKNQALFGQFNKLNNDFIFSIGIGTANNNRKNAFSVGIDGKLYGLDDAEIVIPDMSNYYLKSEVDALIQHLQEQIDALTP